MTIRVAIDVTPLAGAPTGIAHALDGLLGGLAAAHADVALLPYALSTRALRDRGDLPADTTVVPGAAALTKLWSRGDRPRFDRFVRDADVLHATNYLVPPIGRPALVTVHDVSLVRHRHLCTPAVLALEPVLRRAMRRGAHVHTPSAFVAGEVRDLFRGDLAGADHVHVVPWGVPELVDAWPLPDGIGAPFVLAIGTLEPRKNLAHLVAAFGLLESSDVSLVLAGPDGPARPEIDAAVARLAPERAARVHFVGAVDDAARVALLRHAAVLAYPSVYEGFGFPVLEAMACGTPVVAARAGAIPEVAGDAADLVEPTDESGIAAAIDRVLTDAAHRDDLVARGRVRVGAYSWTTCGAGVAALYETITA